MKKIVSYCSVLIMVTAFLFLLLAGDKGMFIVQFLASVGGMVLFPRCVEKYQINAVLFFSVFVAAFDLLFILLFILKPDSSFLGSGTSLAIQFGVPFINSIFQRLRMQRNA